MLPSEDVLYFAERISTLYKIRSDIFMVRNFDDYKIAVSAVDKEIEDSYKWLRLHIKEQENPK